jgi:hypothetical protein
MKRTNTRFLRFPVVVLLLFAMAFVSFTKPNAAVKKYDRKTTNAQRILTDSYAEDFTYVNDVADCSLMWYPGNFPDDTYYVDTDPSFITVGSRIYYDAEMAYPAPEGTYFFYHNEYAEFYKCWVDPFGYVTAVDHCE